MSSASRAKGGAKQSSTHRKVISTGCWLLRRASRHDTDKDHQQQGEQHKQVGIEGHESSFFMAKAHSIATEPPDKSPI
ncbi:Uncharacterised protein [Aeromonas encheleia]|nr:Uncharacterised protein [Aeromonas encheleia]